jgi:integrase
MDRRLLTERLIAELPQATAGKRLEVFDTKTDRLGIRVTESGERSYFLYCRFPRRPDTPTRRRLGRWPEMKVEGARRKAREWLDLIERGVDPADEEERRGRAAAAARANAFTAVAEEYIRQRVIGAKHFDRIAAKAATYPELSRFGALARAARGGRRTLSMRKAPDFILDLDEFARAWGRRPISGIAPRDVRAVVGAALKRGATYRALGLLTISKMFFKWVIAHDDDYGVLVSPCSNLSARQEVGRKKSRDRVLNDGELRALWAVAGGLGYPYGPLIKMLALTGQRKSDVADARWREFNVPEKLWTVPAARAKMEAPLVIPLSDEALTLLAELPRFAEGDHLFTFTFGATPPNSFSKLKVALDERMRAVLGKFEPFIIHDIRRTVRTRLVGPGVGASPEVAELVIGHAKRGLHKVYDHHAYLTEKRAVLEGWARELMRIVADG